MIFGVIVPIVARRVSTGSDVKAKLGINGNAAAQKAAAARLADAVGHALLEKDHSEDTQPEAAFFAPWNAAQAWKDAQEDFDRKQALWEAARATLDDKQREIAQAQSLDPQIYGQARLNETKARLDEKFAARQAAEAAKKALELKAAWDEVKGESSKGRTGDDKQDGWTAARANFLQELAARQKSPEQLSKVDGKRTQAAALEEGTAQRNARDAAYRVLKTLCQNRQVSGQQCYLKMSVDKAIVDYRCVYSEEHLEFDCF